MAAWKLWGPGCECCTGCTGTICFTVKQCDTTTSVAGATVTISLLGVDVATGTTDASGQCCIGITSAATYDYTVVKTGYETKTGTVAATCTTNNVTLTYGASLCVTVAGCNSILLANATVTVKSGGATVGTATTNSSGLGCVQLLASTGSYSVEVSKSRFATNTSTRTITCGSAFSVTLSVAAGYACDYGICADPHPTTLYLTTPAGTSVTLTHSGVAWNGTDTRTIGNAWDCVGANFDPAQQFTTETIVFSWSYAGGGLAFRYPQCSGTDAFTHYGLTDPVTLLTCSSAFQGVAGNGSGVSSDQISDPSTTAYTCTPFDYQTDFPVYLYPCPGYASMPMQYYYGTATITE